MSIILNDIKYEKVIVSVSTGVDSMVLLDLIMKKNIEIVVVHFNHNQRKQSNKEYEFIRKFCMKNNFKFEYKSLEINCNHNFQAEARRLRYDFLINISKKYKIETILTAHHKDDSLENIISKFVSGRNITSISGIKDLTIGGITVERPLLSYSKIEIREYAKSNKIIFFEDESNSESKYTRNNIRNNVIPHIKNSFPNFDKSILNSIDNLNDINNYMDYVTSGLIVNREIDLNNFLELHTALKRHVLYNLLQSYSTNNIINEIINSVTNYDNKKFILKNIVIFVEYGKIFIENNITIPTKSIKISKTGEFIFNDYKIIIKKKNITKICYNDLKLPLTIRNWENGDYIRLKVGNKKLSRIFIDKKIKKIERSRIPIIIDSNNNIIQVGNLCKTIDNFEYSIEVKRS